MEKIKEADSYLVTDPSQAVKIFKSENLENHRKALTLPELLSNTVELYPNHAALKFKPIDSEKWSTVSYKEYKNRAEKIAKCFIKLGLKEFESVAVLAFNCPEWFYAELAAIHAGGNIIGIYTTSSPDACHYILQASRAKIVIVDNSEQLQKILKIKDKLPSLKCVIKIQEPYLEVSSLENIFSWKDLEEMDVDDVQEEYERRLSNICSNQCCCISFTSGTTGNPKGAMMSHDNLIWNTQNISQTLTDLKEGQEVFVSYLPLSHVAAQVVDIFLSISLGGTVYFADKNALKGSLIKTLIDARPTFFFAVPRVYEKIQEKFISSSDKLQGVKMHLVSWAQRTAREFHLNGTSPLMYEVAKYLILDNIKQGLGLDRVKLALIGAASSSSETLKFFYGLDVKLSDAYGMTEASGVVTVSSAKDAKIGTVGKFLSGIEVKIINPDDDGCGEICSRGRNNFMGYLNDIQKTKECIDDDGWLHSGDVGKIDSEGYLRITGRIKELVITAGGENIPFLHIENLVKKECSAISNAFLIGDKRKFLSMLITFKTKLDANNVPTDNLAPESIKLMKDLNLNFTKMSEIKNHPKVIEAIQAAIDRANKNAISNAQKVQKFAILPQDFSVDTGELSPTMKLKRGFVLDKYKKIIDGFYIL